MNVQPQRKTPWYRQFWPWFLLAPLTLSVVLGITMLTMSIQSYDGLVKDSYYKEGLAINQELQKDSRATALGLQARLKVDEVTGELLVTLDGQLSDYPDRLKLDVIHPTVANQDQSISLRHQGRGAYYGQLRKTLHNRWYLQLAPIGSNAWRLKGEANFPLQTAITIAAKPAQP